MDDNLDSNTCKLCSSPFNNSNHLPKIIECCERAFCLQCLNENYAKNNNKLICSNCGESTNINPNSLATDKRRLISQKLKCPKCQKETELNNFLVNLRDNQADDFIFCNKCVQLDMDKKINDKINRNIYHLGENLSLNNLNNYNISSLINSSILSENLPLQDFLEMMKHELNNFSNEKLQLLQSLKANNQNNDPEKTEEKLDLKIWTFVGDYFENLKRNIKVKIKQFMTNHLSELLGFNFEMEEEGRKINSDLIEKISTLISEVKSITWNRIKEAEIAKINKAIKFYLHLSSFDVLIQKISRARSFIESLSFNFAISNKENFVDLLVNNLELMLNNELFFSNAENHAMKDSDVEFLSGIQLIDNEILKLRMNLNNNSLLLLDYSSLTQKNEELQKQLNELKNEKNILERKLSNVVLENIDLREANKKLSNVVNENTDLREAKKKLSNVINENTDLREAKKKLEQQLSDLYVKYEANNWPQRVRVLEGKLKESQVSLSEQKLLNAELKKQFQQCLMELNKIKKEMIKGEIKISDKVFHDFNVNEIGYIKKNNDPKLPKKRAENDNTADYFPKYGGYDRKKNVLEDTNIREEKNQKDQERECERRNSNLYNHFDPRGEDNSRFYALTERNERISTDNTGQKDNDDFRLLRSWLN